MFSLTFSKLLLALMVVLSLQNVLLLLFFSFCLFMVYDFSFTDKYDAFGQRICGNVVIGGK